MNRSHIGVQSHPRDRASWLALARRVEASGFEGLYVADHPGSAAAPFSALAAAAAVTDRIRLGTCVINAGLWEPVALANEVATLDLLSAGRAVLGVGAGHTPQEWIARGLPFPSAGQRVDRMIELVETTTALLRGETVSRRGDHLTLEEAVIVEPRPVQRAVPLLVGGGGERVLRFASQHADRVGVTGTGRTLPDGHSHEVDWSPAGVARIFEVVGAAAEAAGRRPEIDVLVQIVEITDDAPAAAAVLAEGIPTVTVDDLLTNPFVWIGSAAEIAAQLDAHEQTWGISRFTVRAPMLRQVEQILA